MTNYMELVAKMIGVELGEEFEVGELNVPYVLTSEGLFHDKQKCDHILNNILAGKVAIKRRPWRPNFGERFYYVSEATIGESMFLYGIFEKTLCKIGNCYHTIQEAEADREKWVAFYRSDEILEVS